MTPELRAKTARAYGAAADHYERPALAFWQRYGRATVARIPLERGARVLDVCSGSGASAIPAAERVGSGGHVLAVDLAEPLLQLARSTAAARGLTNIEFRTTDFMELGLPSGQFDAAVCVFGIFFLPDMEAGVRELWRMIRPGGCLAITTWGHDVLEPGDSAFWNAVREERPELYRGFNPWDRIATPEGLLQMLSAAGIQRADIEPEAGEQPLDTPDDWWHVVLGSGYRGTVDALTRDERKRVRERTLATMRSKSARAVTTNVIYALARKA